MARLTGLQREMSVLGCMLLVYFMTGLGCVCTGLCFLPQNPIFQRQRYFGECGTGTERWITLKFSDYGVSSQSNTTAIVTSPAARSSSSVASKTVPVTILPTSSSASASTSATPPSPATTKAPSQTTVAPTSSGRKFDGPSFIGGIILGIVLTGIFVFAYKWWQNRNKSYHSL